MSEFEQIVPEQVTGSKTGATSKVKAPSIRAAIAWFNEAKLRLLDVNNWHAITGGKGAEFYLTDENGNPLPDGKAAVGNLIKIALPAPGNETGDGYDWVRIEAFEQHTDATGFEDVFGFRVRPVSNPQSRSDRSAHFYTSDATSSFLVVRRGITLYAMERGRNEKPNPSGGFLNKVRNAVIAVAAMLGLSKPQWKLLTGAILEPKNGKGYDFRVTM
jgi:hypothetical protein